MIYRAREELFPSGRNMTNVRYYGDIFSTVPVLVAMETDG